MRQVIVSAKSMMQRFNGCDPDYIKNVCKGSCCRSSVRPEGILVTIHESEVDLISREGGVVRPDGFLEAVDRRCPFQSKETELCSLHGKPSKPFGCSASPFTISGKTLIVRNRYRLLKCYNDGERQPAYIAFRGSLVRIFGEAETTRLTARLDATRDKEDLIAEMPDESWRMLTDNDAAKRAGRRDEPTGLLPIFGQDR